MWVTLWPVIHIKIQYTICDESKRILCGQPCYTYKKYNIRYAMKVSKSYVGNPVIRIKDTLYDMQ